MNQFRYYRQSKEIIISVEVLAHLHSLKSPSHTRYFDYRYCVTKLDTNKIVRRYCDKVVSNKIRAGKYIQLAVKRHLSDLDSAKDRGLKFCADSANHVVEFFKFLKHSKGEWAGTNFILQDWQIFLLSVQFGWLRQDGLRRFRTAYTELPRKNGKSTMSAGKGLYLLVGDCEPGAEVYTAATKRDQAKIIWSEAVRMVKASEFLKSRIEIFRDNLSIPNTASKFEPLGADEDTLDGLNVHGAFIDELHAHKNRGVYDIIDTATGSRRQPMIDTITTAGFDKLSVCYEIHDYTQKVLEGIISDDSFFGFIAAADTDDDWKDETTWWKANPNLGVSVKLDDLKSKCAKARLVPGYENTFKRLHLNMWTEQSVRWLSMDEWDACAGSVEVDDLQGEECWGGLDLSSTTDLTALALVFKAGSKLKVSCFFFVPEDNARKRAERDRVPYDVWINQGHIIATPGNVVDYDFVRAQTNKLAEVFNIREIAFDPWNATQLAVQLEGDGLKLTPFRQGFSSMSAPTKELEKIILSRRLEHDANPVLRWMASNVTVKSDPAGNLKPAKDISTGRIDGIVALIMAIGVMNLAPESQSFVYDTRGVFVG